MVHSRNKGAQGEREAAKVLNELFGIDARRGQQFAGGSQSPDVVTSVEGVHFEVKRTERLQLDPAMAQATRDAGDKIPVVMHRKNRDDWKFTVRVSDFRELARRLLG